MGGTPSSPQVSNDLLAVYLLAVYLLAAYLLAAYLLAAYLRVTVRGVDLNGQALDDGHELCLRHLSSIAAWLVTRRLLLRRPLFC